MFRNLRKILLIVLLGIVTFGIGENVYATPVKKCSYKNGLITVYYDSDTKIMSVIGAGYGTMRMPDVIPSYTEDGHGTTESAFLTWFLKDRATVEYSEAASTHSLQFETDPEIICPTLYYSGGIETCDYAGDNYICNYTISLTDTSLPVMSQNENISFARQYSCIYDDILFVNYNDAAGNRYANYTDFNISSIDPCFSKDGVMHAGTSADPCLRLGTIYESSDNKLNLGTADNGGWQFLYSDGNGGLKFACPELYYKLTCATEADGKKYCTYSYSPSKFEGASVIRSKSSINESGAIALDPSELPMCELGEDWIHPERYTYDPNHVNPNFDNNLLKMYYDITNAKNNLVSLMDDFIEIASTCTSANYDAVCSNLIYGSGTTIYGNEVTKVFETANSSFRYEYRYKPITQTSNSMEDQLYIAGHSAKIAIIQAIVDYLAVSECQLSSEVITTYLQQIDDILDSKKAEFNAAVDNNDQLSDKDKAKYKDTLDKSLTKVGRFTEVIGAWYNRLLGIPDDSCTGYLDEDLVEIIKEILTWVRIIVPIIVIVLGIVDFSKAVLNAEKDELKQAEVRLAKRLVIAIIIFFVPTLLHLLVEAFNKWSDIPITDLPDCGIK